MTTPSHSVFLSKKKKDSISRYAEAKDLYFLISFARYCEYERGRGTEKEKGAFPGGGEWSISLRLEQNPCLDNEKNPCLDNRETGFMCLEKEGYES